METHVGLKIAALRDLRNFDTQKDLSDKIGKDLNEKTIVSQQTLSNLEKQFQNSCRQMQDIADALAVDMRNLIDTSVSVMDIVNQSTDTHTTIGTTNTGITHIDGKQVMPLGVDDGSGDAINIPVLSNTGSMGDGCDLEDGDIVISNIAIQRDWITKHLPHTKAANLCFIHGAGESMSPTYSDGDVLLVDTGLTAIDIDGVYAMVANGNMFIKRVTRKMDGTLVVTSDNPTSTLADSLDGNVAIKGRIVWAWNGRKM